MKKIGKTLIDGAVLVTLRCRSSDTMKLVDGLNSLGVFSWSPATRFWMRMPRSRKAAMITKPIMPTFVFADRAAIEDVEHFIAKGVPRYSAMRIDGNLVALGAKQLMPLVEVEMQSSRARRVKRAIPIPQVGERVTVSFGPFMGMSGVVMSSDSNYVEVQFENSPFRTQISTFAMASDKSSLD